MNDNDSALATPLEIVPVFLRITAPNGVERDQSQQLGRDIFLRVSVSRVDN